MRMQSRWFFAVVCLLPFIAAALAQPDDVKSVATSADPAFVDGAACAGCHAAQAQSWASSHHAMAMQPATSATVLGDFAGASLTRHGVTTTFSRKGDAFWVRTDGPDGAPHDYQLAYTFGVYPLQQYLIAFPGGRHQALGVAWDARAKDQGGQRWIYLYPGQTIPAGDRLHWTGRDQTWNYQCAACHSTDLKKNYDLGANSYATTWSDVNVSCEACHGPGSLHVAWAEAKARSGAAGPEPAPTQPQDEQMGLMTWLAPAPQGVWRMNPDTGIAQRAEPSNAQELDICARCHSRRKVIAEGAPIGAPFLDSNLPALLEPGLYHADGQIDGEVFEYGSFVQSRMYHAGVTCSDCHEPHNLKLRGEGNALCGQCHLPGKFDVASHHHHEPGGTGAQCVNCHMPAKTYMVVDDRRDHSLRVPRPDLTMTIGVPNACATCHADKSAEWAARSVATWFPEGRQTTRHYGAALDAGRAGAIDAERQLDQLIMDTNQPAIARAGALALLPRYASPQSEAAVKAALGDPNALVRAAAPRALPAAPSPAMVEATAPLLSDSVRAVRIEAARALAGVDPRLMTAQQQTAFAAAYLELYAAEIVDADRPETHLNLGLLETKQQRAGEAEAQYLTALRLDPNFVPALVNLADLDRQRGMNEDSAALLRKAMAIEPDNAEVRHSLGLALVRQKNYVEALDQLRKATELAPANARYAYVYAIALNSTGAPGDAMKLLETAHNRHPTDRDVLAALISMAQETSDLATALRHARELSALNPTDVQLHMLVLELEQRQAR
jgi:Flp pilus assembly protein TadD